MPTILDTLQKGTEYLEKHDVEDARLNMQHLIAHVLKVDRMQIYLDFDREIENHSLEQLRELTKRRGKGEPLQHLLGDVEFCGRLFRTDSRALIPRPETEELTARLAAKGWQTGLRILDVGCGSGVIGLSLAAALGDMAARVVLSDVSPDALALAQENAASLSLGERIEFIESDLCSAIDGMFDLVVANLPYIPSAEATALSREVLQDPEIALYGGEVGTELINRFLEEILPHLAPGATLALEFGIGQEDSLRIRAEDLGYEAVEIAKDLGGIARFLFAVNPT